MIKQIQIQIQIHTYTNTTSNTNTKFNPKLYSSLSLLSRDNSNVFKIYLHQNTNIFKIHLHLNTWYTCLQENNNKNT